MIKITLYIISTDADSAITAINIFRGNILLKVE
jgi:hypothetical protein